MLLLIAALFAPHAAAAWHPDMTGCRVFNKDQKQGARTSFPAGSLAPEQQGNNAYTASSYRARATMTDAGDLETTIYDCPERMTANGIAVALRTSLQHDGYTLRFACEDSRCGPPAGWQKVLGLRAAPDASGFSYTLVRRRTDTGIEHIAIYATNLDQQPRIVIYDLDADYDISAKLAFDRSRVEPLYQTDQSPAAAAYFDTGLSRIKNPKALKSALSKTYKPNQRWIIVGHADRRGKDAANGILSWHRARAVARVLKDSGVPQSEISLYALGEPLSPVAGDQDIKQKPNQSAKQAADVRTAPDRRADVFRLKRQPKKQPEKNKKPKDAEEA